MFNKNPRVKHVVKKRQAVRGQSVKKRHTKKVSNKLLDAFSVVYKFAWEPKLITGLSILFISVFGYNNINLNNVLPIQSIKIEGEFKFLNKVKLQSHALPAVKGGFFNVNLQKVRAALVNLPWVQSVAVRRQWPNALSIYVVEKKPVVTWGEDGVISAKGALFVPVEKVVLNLPHLSGPQGQHEIMLQELARMQAWLLETGLYIKNIELNARRSWILTMVSGMELRLGREQMHERLNRFVSVYKETLQAEMLKKTRFKNARFKSARFKNVRREIKYVDMRYTNGFAVAWKEA